MTVRIMLAVVLASVSASWGCGPTPQVAGDWSGLVAPDHNLSMLIRITQEGRVLRGTACQSVSTSLGSFVPFRNATVSGSYPTLRVFSASYQGGWTFEGEFNDSGTKLSGHYYSASNSGYEMSLGRPPDGHPFVGSCLN